VTEFDRQTDDSLRFDRSWASYALDAVGRAIQRFVKWVWGY